MKRTRCNHGMAFKVQVASYCTPGIFSTDQGCQFTNQEATGC